MNSNSVSENDEISISTEEEMSKASSDSHAVPLDGIMVVGSIKSGPKPRLVVGGHFKRLTSILNIPEILQPLFSTEKLLVFYCKIISGLTK